MAFLEELSKYKEKVVEILISDMDLCKAVYYNNQNFLDQDDFDTSLLIYNNIFPFRFIPDAAQTQKTFITLTFGRITASSSTIKSERFCLNVFTHRDLFRTDYNATRVDFIINKIDQLMNRKRSLLGLGQLEFGYLDDIVVNDMFQGSTICYLPKEFNVR